MILRLQIHARSIALPATTCRKLSISDNGGLKECVHREADLIVGQPKFALHALDYGRYRNIGLVSISLAKSYAP
jgi:hypothetical protein